MTRKRRASMFNGKGCTLFKNTSQKGYSSLLVLILVPVTSMLVYSLVNMAIISRKQSIINKNIVGYSSLLDASIDYTMLAIKNRWCMTGNWIRDNSNCNILNTRNLERLTLDLQAVNALRDIYYGDPSIASSAVLKSIEGVINMSTVTSGHPLFRVKDNLKSSAGGEEGVQNIRIQVNRVDSRLIPQRGRESHLEIIASLESGGPLFRGLSSLKARSRIIVVPRELNYFSLVVANDLYLDRAAVGNSAGDFFIPAAGSLYSPGVQFQSPVYANGDVYIPKEGGLKSSVLFTQRLVLGGANANGKGGRIVTDTGVAQPKTAGGYADQTYSTMASYSGFKKGVDIDGERDAGLDVFAGLNPNNPLSGNEYHECRLIGRMKNNLSMTAKSDLLVKQAAAPVLGGGNAPDRYQYTLALNQRNYFKPQEVQPYFHERYKATSSTNQGASVMFVRVEVGSPTDDNYSLNKFTMNRSMSVQMTFKDNVAPYVPTYLTVTTGQVLNGNGVPRPELVQFTVSAVGDKTQIPGQIKIDVEAFDVANWAGRDRRSSAHGSEIAGYSRDADFIFSAAGGALTPTNPTSLAGTTYIKAKSSNIGTPIESIPISETNPTLVLDTPDTYPFDLAGLLNKCDKDNVTQTVSSSAFKAIGWDTSFAQTTRFSWYFSPLDANDPNGYENRPVNSTLNIPNSTGPDGFTVSSIVGHCVIPQTTNFVAGFFICDELTIQPRNSPLTVIGTIIAGKGSIASSAVQNGVIFKSIYHPEATVSLRGAGILEKFDGGACPTVPAFPIWWPSLSEKDYFSLRNCNTVSLRDKANPLTWTAVDPDCGLTGGSAYVQCKKHATRLLVREISRESDLQ